MTLHGTREGRDITRLFSGTDDRVARLRGALDLEARQAALEERREAERKTASLLAKWLEDESIAKGEAAEETAETLAESSLMRADVAVLLGGGEASQALRDAAVSLAAVAGIDPAELAADRYWHGHGKRTCRIGEVVND